MKKKIISLLAVLFVAATAFATFVIIKSDGTLITAFSDKLAFEQSGSSFTVNGTNVKDIVSIYNKEWDKYDDYERAFTQGYLDSRYYTYDRKQQVTSQEFKAMLKQMVEKFGPDSMNYFNRHISDENIPLTRNIAVGMVYYTAKCIGADEVNRTMNVPELSDEWEGAWDADIVKVLPLYRDKPASDAGIPEDKYWLAWEEIMQAYVWNNMHVSPYSNKEVIECDRAAKTFHMREALVWEDAICAITRLYDSMDPAKMAAGISTLRITPDYQSGVYYNLQGQRVENPVKGIYIKNGKKMIYK